MEVIHAPMSPATCKGLYPSLVVLTCMAGNKYLAHPSPSPHPPTKITDFIGKNQWFETHLKPSFQNM